MARLSIIAGLITSHTLAVNVVCQRGRESGGNAVTPVTTEHPAEQESVAAELCPTVITCDDDKYQNTVPLVTAPLSVAVIGAVITKNAVLVRTWQGLVVVHNAPSVCTVPEVLFTLKSRSCD